MNGLSGIPSRQLTLWLREPCSERPFLRRSFSRLGFASLKRGGGDLDWDWLIDYAESEFLITLAGRANSIGYDGGRRLLPRLIELDRREALNLLKHLGLSEAGMPISELLKCFGAEAVLRLDPPMHEDQHWAWLQLNYELIGASALAEAERWVGQRGSPEQRIDLAQWMTSEGDFEGALRAVGEQRHPLRWALLEQTGGFDVLVEQLWPSRRRHPRASKTRPLLARCGRWCSSRGATCG